MMLIKPVPLEHGAGCLGYMSLTEYTGTKAELIASGVAREDMFPIGRKRVESRRFDDADFKDYHSWSLRRVKGGLFKVKVWRIKEREQPRPAPWKDEADFRRHLIEPAEIVLEALINRADGERGYRYSEASLQRLAELSEEILSLLAGGGLRHGARAVGEHAGAI